MSALSDFEWEEGNFKKNLVVIQESFEFDKKFAELGKSLAELGKKILVS